MEPLQLKNPEFDFDSLVEGKVRTGRISEMDRNSAHRFIGDRVDPSLSPADLRHARIAAAEAWVEEVKRDRAALADRTLKHLAAFEEAARHPHGIAAGVAALISDTPTIWSGGEFVGALRRSLFQRTCLIFHDTLTHSTPSERRHDISDDGFIRDLLGDRPGNDSTAAAANAWREAIAALNHSRDATNRPAINHVKYLIPVPWRLEKIAAAPGIFRQELQTAIAGGAFVPSEFRYFDRPHHKTIENLIDVHLGALDEAGPPDLTDDPHIEGQWRNADAWLRFWQQWGSEDESLFEIALRHLDRAARVEAAFVKFGDDPEDVKRRLVSVAGNNAAAAPSTGPYFADPKTVAYQDLQCFDFPRRWAQCAVALNPDRYQGTENSIAAAIELALEAFWRLRHCKQLQIAERFSWAAKQRLLAVPTAILQRSILARTGPGLERGGSPLLAIARRGHDSALVGLADGWRTPEIAANFFITLTLLGAEIARRPLSAAENGQWPPIDPHFWRCAARRARATELFALLLEDTPLTSRAADDAKDLGQTLARHIMFNRSGASGWYRRLKLDGLVARQLRGFAHLPGESSHQARLQSILSD